MYLCLLHRLHNVSSLKLCDKDVKLIQILGDIFLSHFLAKSTTFSKLGLLPSSGKSIKPNLVGLLEQGNLYLGI